MPFLIKSSNGQRSYKLVNNSDNKQSHQQQANTLDDIISALRGLTFKLEVKIADVVSTNHSGQTLSSASSESEIELANENEAVILSNSLSQAERVPRSLMTTTIPEPKLSSMEMRIPDPVPISSPPVKVGESIPEKPRIPQPSPPKSQPPEPTEPAQIPYNPPVPKPATVAPPIAETPEPVLAEKIRPDKSPMLSSPRPKLVRGHLKIGTTIKTCCIAIDESASPPIAYVSYDYGKLMSIVDLICNESEQIEGLPKIPLPKIDDIILGKSCDDNSWYRATVEAVEGDLTHVYFFDWGLREVLPLDRIRHLNQTELGLSNYPACALKIRFTNKPGELLDEVFKCESLASMRIESYDEASECYQVTILEI